MIDYISDRLLIQGHDARHWGGRGGGPGGQWHDTKMAVSRQICHRKHFWLRHFKALGEIYNFWKTKIPWYSDHEPRRARNTLTYWARTPKDPKYTIYNILYNILYIILYIIYYIIYYIIICYILYVGPFGVRGQYIKVFRALWGSWSIYQGIFVFQKL